MSKCPAESYALKIWNDKDLSAIEEFLDPDIVIHSLLGEFKGPSKMKEVVQSWLSAFPDLKVNNTHILRQNDLVVMHWRAEGKHQGPFKGHSPTGKKVSYPGVSLYKVKNNKVIEYWAYVDMNHLLSQLK
jgi:predicted ester cyclase